MAGMVCHHNIGAVGVHDDGYKAMWKRDREAAIARGEDPDAIAEAKLAARKEKALLKKLQRLLRNEKGQGAGGSSARLSKEEEELAKSRDKQRILEDDEETLY
ncbi:hypothetical protein MMC26_006110 [Xylographa opegraphella]|nr:hypothetical protein [Xylographa opegraphella]